MKQAKLTILMTLSASVSTTLLATFLALSFASSSQATTPGATPRKKQTRTAYRAELDALIKEHGVACKFSLDCEAHPLGVKPCGGPTEFLVMSKATRLKMQDALTDLTKTIGEMDSTSNEGVMGTCVALTKPELACVAGACVIAKSK